MKRIINGKRYDTDTATELGFDSNQGDWRDFSHWCETLYRKRTGEFFLYGEGGPRTRYAQSCGDDGWTSGSKIIPLTWEEARKWAEEHLSVDEYEEIFGPVSESDEKEVFSLSLTKGALETARRAAAQMGMNLNAYIESLILK